jgi:hypothetical protein
MAFSRKGSAGIVSTGKAFPNSAGRRKKPGEPDAVNQTFRKNGKGQVFHSI